MRKHFVLASLMLALLTLTALMPVVKAATYSWDGIRFVEGQYIHYPHPDRDYYGISPFSEWSKKGYKLYHKQFDQAKSITIAASLPAIGAAAGAVLGVMIGGLYGAVIGGATGVVLVIILTWVPLEFFLDEWNCIWWWISITFMDWLTANAWWLGLKCLTNPSGAQNDILYAFLSYGYLRVGSVTFYDAVGAGNPVYVNLPPLTPSTPSGSTSGYPGVLYTYSTSTTDPNENDVRYHFDWGDGSTNTTGWYASGSTASASHSWTSTGVFNVRVWAKDEHDEWSGYSSLTVSVTVNPHRRRAGGGGRLMLK